MDAATSIQMSPTPSPFASPQFAAACAAGLTTLVAVILGGMFFTEATQQRKEIREVATEVAAQVGAAKFHSEALVREAARLAAISDAAQVRAEYRGRSARVVAEFNAALKAGAIEVDSIRSRLSMYLDSDSEVLGSIGRLETVVRSLYECAGERFALATSQRRPEAPEILRVSERSCQGELEGVEREMAGFNRAIRGAAIRSDRRMRRWMYWALVVPVVLFLMLFWARFRERRVLR
jgi:hypothetical protein